jgi:hypothetical protein
MRITCLRLNGQRRGISTLRKRGLDLSTEQLKGHALGTDLDRLVESVQVQGREKRVEKAW